MTDAEELTIPPAPESPWHQLNIRVPDERTGATRLAAVMGSAGTEGLIDAWFFIRKGQWRIRFRPASPDLAGEAHTAIATKLAGLRQAADLSDGRGVAYEPEIHAFGGAAGMDATHRLWHIDSQQVVHYLAGLTPQADGDVPPDRRRETSVLLLSTMLRAAELDWYEQGDVWGQVATEHRPLGTTADPGRLELLTDQMRSFMTADTKRLAPNSPLAFSAPWMTAFADAGNALAQHARHGALTRGVRRILAQQFIFHWNRLGLTGPQQAMMCAAGRAVVLPR